MADPRFIDCPNCRRQMIYRQDALLESPAQQQMISETYHCPWCAVRIERVLPVTLAVNVRMIHPERVTYLEKRAVS